jgi:hypothetical protein
VQTLLEVQQSCLAVTRMQDHLQLRILIQSLDLYHHPVSHKHKKEVNHRPHSSDKQSHHNLQVQGKLNKMVGNKNQINSCHRYNKLSLCNPSLLYPRIKSSNNCLASGRTRWDKMRKHLKRLANNFWNMRKSYTNL